MTDLITAEKAQKLLDGTTPGPWQVEAEWNVGNNHISIMHGSISVQSDSESSANARLTAAAPDLARTALALHQKLADAEAAQALVLTEAAAIAKRCVYQYADPEPPILSLASPSGVEALAALRADVDRLTRWRAEEGEKIKRQRKALTDLTRHCRRVEAERDGLARKVAAVQRSGDELAHSELADLQARVHNQRQEIGRVIAERDDLRARLAAAEAQVGALREALIDHNDILRSTFHIAEREGVKGMVASTNWDAFYNRVAVILKRYHKLRNEASTALASAQGVKHD